MAGGRTQGNELKLTEATKRGRRPTSGPFTGLDDHVKDSKLLALRVPLSRISTIPTYFTSGIAFC